MSRRRESSIAFLYRALVDGKVPKGSRRTSAQAASSVENVAADLRLQVWRAIYHSKDEGRTCDECEVELRMLHQTASARIWELHGMGVLKDSGRERPTRTNRKAIVWCVPKRWLQWIKKRQARVGIGDT